MLHSQFAEILKGIATDTKTLYVMGCFGAPMTVKNKVRYTSNHSYNKSATRVAMINKASSDTFGFDCAGLIKGVLWGWSGDKSHTYGGAKYATNNVPDINADSIIKACKDVSTNFNNIVVGEAVWLPGHIGVYIGNGLVVECTPSWSNGVQITAVGNIGKKAGYNTRTWSKHGKLPYIDYVESKWTPSVGDIVDYRGTVHYASANATFAIPCRGGKAKITGVYQLGKSKHPYHLVRVTGSGSTVYGWVDAGSFVKAT